MTGERRIFPFMASYASRSVKLWLQYLCSGDSDLNEQNPNENNHLRCATTPSHICNTVCRCNSHLPLEGSSLSRCSPGRHLWAVDLWVVLCGPRHGSIFSRHGGAEGWGWSWLQHFKIPWAVSWSVWMRGS